MSKKYPELPPAHARHLGGAKERAISRDDYLIYDTSECIMSQLESYADEFERLAVTREQRILAASFQKFAGVVINLMSGKSNVHELRGQEMLVPGDGPKEFTPLAERIREVLRLPAEQPDKAPESTKNREIER